MEFPYSIFHIPYANSFEILPYGNSRNLPYGIPYNSIWNSNTSGAARRQVPRRPPAPAARRPSHNFQ